MYLQFRFILIFIALIYRYATLAILEKNLKYFEKIHPDSLRHNVVKSGAKETNHPFNKIHEIRMDIFGKEIRLILSPKYKVLHSKFKAYEVDGGGREKTFHIDRQSFYEGRVFGETSSYVKMHIDHGVLTGTIHLRDEDEIYHIEVSNLKAPKRKLLSFYSKYRALPMRVS